LKAGREGQEDNLIAAERSGPSSQKPIERAKVNSATVSLSAILIALGVALSLFQGIFAIPIGPVKIFPFESMINVIAGVMLGPWYAVAIALTVSTVRLGLGTGTIFAYPGSLPGALLVGLTYRYIWKNPASGFIEIIGTGIVGAVLSALVFAPLLSVQKSLAFFVFAFIPPAVIGSIIGYAVLIAIKRRVRRQLGLQFP
jgi:energy coupling factor transporter S component ThiW